MTSQAKELAGTELGLYVHIPFCATTCDFCAFYQKRPGRGDIENYLDGIATELNSYPAAEFNRVSTIFWGGGTPGLLAPKDIEVLGAMIRDRVGNAVSEWTVEMAPITVHPDRIRVLREMSVSRISMGVQSFDDALLSSLGRLHPRKQIFRAWDILTECGFENVNLDLIFAIPGQDDRALLNDLRQAIDLGPKHISTYCLTFEEDTALYVKLSEGKVAIDEEKEARQYRLAWETLEAAGFAQYEVSNFAQPGFACQHNINTWRMQEWIGVGPSASSQFAGRRYTNPPSLQDWRGALSDGTLAQQRIDQIDLTPEILSADALAFGLRKNEGLPLDIALGPWDDRALYRYELFPWLKSLEDEGLATIQNERIILTIEGRLVADAIGSEIMERMGEEIFSCSA